MDEKVSMFMSFTSVEDPQVATNFLEMSGGDLDTAVGLFFEHGAELGQATNPTTNTTDVTFADTASVMNADDDAAMAQRLQQEMYQEQSNQEEQVRRPIEPMHDQLVDYMGPRITGEQGMFGQVQGSIFNQTENNNFVDVSNDFVEDSDEDYEVMDENGEIIELDTTNRRRRRRIPANDARTSAQRRLANIFRPPFDIIEKLDLDSAKVKARGEKKWILINIQDVTDFRCQCLNRDFWASNQVKEIVKENFVFLQYQHDSQSGQMYANLYPFTDYPHIAILDPMTGERLKMWSENPEIHKWIEQVVDFMDRFSLDKGKLNPIVRHKQKLNVEALSEEQQLDLAMKKSLGATHDEGDDDVVIIKDVVGGTEDDPIDLDESDEDEDEDELEFEDAEDEHEEEPKKPVELTYAEKITAIVALDRPEPTDIEPKLTTRIQIRSGIDGKRVVKKFALSDNVLKLYQFVKFHFKESIGDNTFTLTMQRTNLFEELDKTIEESGLKNASVLLEVLDENDE